MIQPSLGILCGGEFTHSMLQIKEEGLMNHHVLGTVVTITRRASYTNSVHSYSGRAICFTNAAVLTFFAFAISCRGDCLQITDRAFDPYPYWLNQSSLIKRPTPVNFLIGKEFGLNVYEPVTKHSKWGAIWFLYLIPLVPFTHFVFLSWAKNISCGEHLKRKLLFLLFSYKVLRGLFRLLKGSGPISYKGNINFLLVIYL